MTPLSGVILDYEHPHGGPVKSVGQPFLLGDRPRSAGLPPPMHAEHTHVILQEMGFSSKQIEELKASKVVA